MMDSSQQPQPSHILHTSPKVRPPISPSHYDYLPKRSAPASPPDNNLHGGIGPSTRTHNISGSTEITRPHPFRNTASPSYFNGNVTSSANQPSMSHNNSADTTPPAAVVPRKRAHVEDILNPVHEEVIVSKAPPPPPPPPPPPTADSSTINVAKPRPSKQSTQAPPTPAPKQIIPPSAGSAITISSSTVSSSKSTPTSTLPNLPIKQPKSIRLHVPLNGSTNVYINFASLAEKTYGPEIFNSKRLLGPQGFASSFLNHDRILDTGSDSEAEDDDAGPTSDKNEDAGETEDGGKKKTPVKRRRRQNVADKYDVEDPFIDDSEALMEQVAAASKDGFFVYSGPLIAEGERAKIDKAEQPKKRKAPAKKPPAEKVPRAKKTKEKDKGGKATESGVEDVPQVIAQ